MADVRGGAEPVTPGGATGDGLAAADRLAARTWAHPEWSVPDLIAAKVDRSVSVVVPTRDHADVVVDALHGLLPLVGTLVDDVVVVDAGSTDATIDRAESCGVRVETCTARDAGDRSGRGEAIWRSLEVIDGDIVVFVDPRLGTSVAALTGPLLTDEGVSLVKGFRRRSAPRLGEVDNGDGRLTELLIRPLLASLRPQLTGVVSPLGREFAASRALLTALSIAPGPSADIGILLDALQTRGIDSIAQVGLGEAQESDPALTELGPIGRQIVATLMDRSGVVDSGAPLTSYRAVEGGFEAHRAHPTLRDLPPMSTVNLTVR
ncbi:glycosyltransferase [Williamsia sp.]|uniref:glycosyltransferase n=1 Tax=Williamsia sp. TaxID=1872085 RepID=UPI001A2478E3|nr:glycosyltransferase [Williamsia sp.]MBJ7287446.1 glycosyltransferase [Williamsia sp.]